VAQPGLSIQTIKSLQLYIPPLAEQEALVAQIETLEAQIAQAQAVIDAAPAQKQAILKKYL
jgi:restriction endonuclease S subunit